MAGYGGIWQDVVRIMSKIGRVVCGGDVLYQHYNDQKLDWGEYTPAVGKPMSSNPQERAKKASESLG